MANENKKEFKIPNDVKDFASLTKKKYEKKYADPYMSKDEKKKAYYDMLIDELPAVIKLLVNYSNVREVVDMKHDVYERLFDKKLIKKITKIVENDIDEIENICLLPIIIYDVIKEANKVHSEELKDDEKAADFDLTDVVDLSRLILKKKLKKLVKAGVNEDLAFDVLSIIPSNSVLKNHGMYRLRQMMMVLYNYSKTVDIDFDKLIKYVVSSDYYPSLIAYLLLEKKSDYVNYDEKQKEFFNKVTDWCFNTMEGLEKEEIREILKTYFNYRKRDKQQNKDSNRRFFIGTLPADEFPNITKVVEKMKAADNTIEEFL